MHMVLICCNYNGIIQLSLQCVCSKDGLDTNSSSLKQELKDYQSLQYYQLFDWKKE